MLAGIDFRVKAKHALLFLGLLTITMTQFGCVSGQGAYNGIRVSGPGDLGYLSILVNDRAGKDPTIPSIGMYISEDSIADLKSGKTDVALLGREPTAQELQGLKDYVIGYDAVCLIIDQSSGLGGVMGPQGTPVAKTAGLKNLTTDDVKLILTKGYSWDGYFQSKPNLDPGSILWTLEGGKYAWDNPPRVITSAFTFPIGKFDSQTVLYQELGLDEKQMLAGRTSFTCPQFSIEEEVISYEYNGTMYSQSSGIQNFAFKVAFASRRTMTLANLNAPVRVLTINGIDPVVNPQSIYDGSYPFSRKIHLLIKDNSSTELQNFANLMVSQVGQQFMKDSGYLPLALIQTP